jgi:hypothetical protein
MAEPVAPFASVEEADAYNLLQIFGQAWVEVEPELKTAALNTATQLINDHVSFTIDLSAGIPQSLANATSELARVLVERGDPTIAGDSGGLKRLKAGPVDLTFADPAKKDRLELVDDLKQLQFLSELIPPYILAMISHIITVPEPIDPLVNL